MIVGNDISNDVEYGINQLTGAGIITGNLLARTGSVRRHSGVIIV